MAVFSPESSLVAEVIPSPNHGERKNGVQPSLILLHYTGMPDAQAALAQLCSKASEVSSHYFVFENGHIVQLVHEDRRAWHAGVGAWGGETDLNSCSIGIEIANPGHEHGYPDYPKRQIAAVTALCRGIVARRKILPHRVLAHSDIAPQRKQDPGEKFPWKVLHDSGLGLWVPPEPIVEGPFFSLGDRAIAIEEMQMHLHEIGYLLEPTARYDGETMAVVAAFQRHFRPERVDGIADASTRMTIAALLKAWRAVRDAPPPEPAA